MRYAVCILAILYALLSIYASAAQWKKPARRKPALIMIVGALVLIAAAVLELNGWAQGWLAVVIGSLLICQAALINGKLSGRVQLQHHALRFLITAFLILGAAFW